MDDLVWGKAPEGMTNFAKSTKGESSAEKNSYGTL